MDDDKDVVAELIMWEDTDTGEFYTVVLDGVRTMPEQMYDQHKAAHPESTTTLAEYEAAFQQYKEASQQTPLKGE